MRPRRPPLAEVDTWSLWLALRRGDWATVLPWLLLLGGFCSVLAGMASFFWLTARNDPVDIAGLLVLLLGFAAYLTWRLSSRRAFAVGAVAALLGIAGAVFALWLLAFVAAGQNLFVGIVGILIECGIGITLGLAGINRLDPATKATSEK